LTLLTAIIRINLLAMTELRDMDSAYLILKVDMSVH